MSPGYGWPGATRTASTASSTRPFALLVALPFRVVGEWGWFAIEIAALVWIMLDASKSLGWPSRVLVVIAGVLFLPAMSDLLLGNVTIVLTALALIAIRSDRIGAGVAFGIALAAVPKPLFIPLLLWMVAYRRRSLTGTIAGGLVATAVGVLILGVDRYVDFFTALSTGAGIPTDFVGNLGLSAVSPAVGILGNVAAIAAVVAAIAFLSGRVGARGRLAGRGLHGHLCRAVLGPAAADQPADPGREPPTSRARHRRPLARDSCSPCRWSPGVPWWPERCQSPAVSAGRDA